jgi:DNA-damage-inducible protein J
MKQASEPQVYGDWFRAKVQEALADSQPPVPHRQVMDETQALIDKKRRARASTWMAGHRAR